MGLHRALFTGATALLGVGGSLLATDARLAANWCLVVGAALLMYVEDRAADIDLDARTLARSSSKPLGEIRLDVFLGRHPRSQTAQFLVAVAILAAWAILLAVEG